MKRLFHLAFISFALAGPAGAQTVSFTISKPAANPRLSEPFKLQLEASYPADHAIKPDTASFQNEYFELLGITKKGEAVAGGIRKEMYEIDAAAFNIGLSTFPETGWLLIKDAEIKEAKSPSFQLEIDPLFDPKKGSQNDISDIYPPLRFVPWLWMVLGLLALSVAIYFIMRRFHKEILGPASPPPDTRTPHEKALDALKALLDSGIWEKGLIKDFYVALSDIFRVYLYAQLHINAALMTTNDILREIRTVGADITSVVKTRELLEAADMVKFAKSRPGQAERDQAVERLKGLLDIFNTKPAAAPQGGDKA